MLLCVLSLADRKPQCHTYREEFLPLPLTGSRQERVSSRPELRCDSYLCALAVCAWFL